MDPARSNYIQPTQLAATFAYDSQLVAGNLRRVTARSTVRGCYSIAFGS
jgi:hypothetical protein